MIARGAIESVGTLIDEAALDLGRWQDVVDELARTVPGTRVAFQVIDPAFARATSMVAPGWDAPALSDYASHFGKINPWIPALLRAPVMRTLISEQEVAPAILRKTEVYQDWLRPIGEADASTGMKVVDHDGRLGAITFSHGTRDAERVNTDGALLLEALAPRIRRSLEIGRIAATRAWAEQTGTLVASIVDAAIVVTHDGRLQEANHAADPLIAAGAVLRIEADQRVRFADAWLDNAFAKGLRRAISSRVAGEVRIPSPTGDFAVSILGLRPDMLKTRGLTALLGAAGSALVMIRSVERGGPNTIEHVLGRHGLTRAEIRLALTLDGSRTLKVVAADLGIAHSTARTQIQSIFTKLKISRQAELIAFMFRNSVPE